MSDGDVVVASASATVCPAAGDITFGRMKSDVAEFFGMDQDPKKVDLAGRVIRQVIDDLNRKQVWDFNIVTSPDITTVVGQAEYTVPGDFWKLYNARKTSDLDYMLTTMHRRNFDVQFQSQINITGFPYVLHIKNTFRDCSISVFPAPDGIYTLNINYFKLIGRPTEDSDELDIPQPYQTVVQYGALERFGLLNDRIDLAGYWGKMFREAYDEMKRSDENLGDEDLRFMNIEEIASRGLNFLNPAARPRAYDLW